MFVNSSKHLIKLSAAIPVSEIRKSLFQIALFLSLVFAVLSGAFQLNGNMKQSELHEHAIVEHTFEHLSILALIIPYSKSEQFYPDTNRYIKNISIVSSRDQNSYGFSPGVSYSGRVITVSALDDTRITPILLNPLRLSPLRSPPNILTI